MGDEAPQVPESPATDAVYTIPTTDGTSDTILPSNFPYEPATRSSAVLVADAPTSPALAYVQPQGRDFPVLAQPFPRSWSLFAAVGAALAIILGAAIQLLVVHSDWAQAALASGVIAFLIATAMGVFMAARYVIGRRSRGFLALGGALIASLLLTGVGTLAASQQLHRIQGDSLASAGQYKAAIQQYLLYGEQPPKAPDVARTLATWGDKSLAQKAYADAAQHYTAAIYANPTNSAIATRANAGLFKTYSAWLAGDSTNLPYPDAIAMLKAYQSDSACDSACQKVAANLEAQARFLYGTQLAGELNFADAIPQFEAVQSQFASSDYAAKAHISGAKAYLALGQQQVAGANYYTSVDPKSTLKTCAPAVATYQKLASTYQDTPEGQQATTALAAPQSVTGKLLAFPSNPLPRAHLSTFANPSARIFSDEYSTGIDQTSGVFTFTNVAQGNYVFSTSRDVGYKVDFVTHPVTGSGDLYLVHVGPLCPFVVGETQYTQG